MNSRELNSEEINERFDVRFGRLLKAGFKRHKVETDIGYSRPAEIHSLVGKRTMGLNILITHSEIMWKPLENFDTDVQSILGV